MTGLVWVRLVDGRLWHIDESRLETEALLRGGIV